MSRARSFAGILWALTAIGFAGGCTGASIGPPADLAGEQDGDGVQPDWTRAAAYLDSLFDPQQSLCREYPGASTFWTAPDNALAGRALSYLATPASPDPTHGPEIIARLQSLRNCACNDDPGHDGLSNHWIDPLVIKGAKIPLKPRSMCKGTPRLVPPPATQCGDASSSCLSPGAMVWSADHVELGWVAGYCQPGPCATADTVGWDSEGMGQGVAEVLGLQLLNRKNRGLDPMPLWQHLASKWNGQGLFDRVAATEGKYSTAGLALFKICARVLGQPLPGGVDRKLTEAQNAQGGFRTHYDLNGQFNLDQLGNAATTAQVILAFRKPGRGFLAGGPVAVAGWAVFRPDGRLLGPMGGFWARWAAFRPDGPLFGRMGGFSAGWTAFRPDGRLFGRMDRFSAGWAAFGPDGRLFGRVGGFSAGWPVSPPIARPE